MVAVTHMPAQLRDVWAFERMRPEDAAEVMASDGYSPVQAVIESWAKSKGAWTMRLNGEVAAMYGIVPLSYGTALAPMVCAWLLTTVVVDRYPKTFVKESRRVVKELHATHGVLINFVDARYTRAVRWARKTGFYIQDAVPIGKNGEPFHLIHFGE